MADKDVEKYTEWWRTRAVLKEGFYMNWEHLDELKSCSVSIAPNRREFSLALLIMFSYARNSKEIYYLLVIAKKELTPILY